MSQTPNFHVIIPARYASSRLPGKPLLEIAGKPMVQHVYEQALKSDADKVIVATDHADIVAACEQFGAPVVLTKQSHESGTDRLQEVVEKLELDPNQVIVNVQGDEPLIPPAVINQTAQLLSDPAISMATLYELCQSAEQVLDPNVVKVVTSEQGGVALSQAIYFSRAPIPYNRDLFAGKNLGDASNFSMQALSEHISYKRHLGIYAYRVGLLHQFVTWPMAAIEQVEKLEQLRVMAQGYQINIAEACQSIPPGVDTQADLDAVRAHFEK